MPAAAARSPLPASSPRSSPRSVASSRDRAGHASCTPVRSSSAEPCVSASTWSAKVRSQRRKDAVDPRREREVAGVQQHHLLLDPDGPRPTSSGDGQRPQAGRTRVSSGPTTQAARRVDAARRAGRARSRSSEAVTRCSEEGELRGVVDQRLGVPLNPEQERLPPALDALDDAVLRPRDRMQAVAEPLDALVVKGVDVHAVATDHGRESAAGGDADLVRGLVVPARAGGARSIRP